MCPREPVFAMSEDGIAGDGDLTVEHRRTLAGILNADVRLTEETVSVLIATERAAEGLDSVDIHLIHSMTDTSVTKAM